MAPNKPQNDIEELQDQKEDEQIQKNKIIHEESLEDLPVCEFQIKLNLESKKGKKKVESCFFWKHKGLLLYLFRKHVKQDR